MILTYRESDIRDSFHYVFANCPEHYKDIFTEGLPESLELDIDYILELEKAGSCKTLIALNNNEIVGMISGTIYSHLLFKDKMFGSTFLIYANKDLGIKRLGVIKGLLVEYEKLLRDKYNVEYFQVAFSASKDLSKIMKRLGYLPSDIVMAKKLGDNK